jgi:hypothetical protein
MKPSSAPREAWPKAMATVTACTYEFGAGRALAFGVPSDKHFRIAFNYWANNELHTGEFFSEKAIPQGTLYPITYNPAVPQEHSHSSKTSSTRNPVLMVGIIGSIILTAAWFFVLRGCR